ncbi:ImuA family protein [Methylopila henanensis]|uniref:ImuA family protein n=1 Tax=Methylopila henanensis TaxID=873516 RepID=A0ABW4K363_9HYPH
MNRDCYRNKRETKMLAAHENALARLRKDVAALERGACRRGGASFRLGLPPLDAALGGGLARGVLHEVYARGQQDAVAAAGFGLGVALRAADGRALVWARQDLLDVEAGALYGDGLAAFGADPKRLLVVRARDPTGVLRAAAEAARCAAVGAAVIEIWGEPKTLDLNASRRLALAAGASGVTVVMIRLGAKQPAPSAATSRWSVAAAASAPLEANAPGRPAFEAALLRHRAGVGPRTWLLEWDRDRASFEPAPLSRFVVSVPARGPGAADAGAPWRRAG